MAIRSSYIQLDFKKSAAGDREAECSFVRRRGVETMSMVGHSDVSSCVPTDATRMPLGCHSDATRMLSGCCPDATVDDPATDTTRPRHQRPEGHSLGRSVRQRSVTRTGRRRRRRTAARRRGGGITRSWTSSPCRTPRLPRRVALSASSLTHVLSSQHSAEKSNSPTYSSHPAQTTTPRRGAA